VAHIPMGDIRELWKSTPQHSWGALEKNLEGRRGKTEGIADSLVDDMIWISKQMEKSGQAFSSSEQQLYDVMNQHIPGK